LAAESGLSRQHLTRRFRESVGVGPKFFSRVARFHALFHRLYKDASRNWVGAALDLGYYDQAHMISDFREFTGRTPLEYFSAVSGAQVLAEDNHRGHPSASLRAGRGTEVTEKKIA
jgi:AraC-like DNA-binding protein